MQIRRQERHTTSLIFVLILIFLILDITEDLKDGASLNHLFIEVCIVLAGAIGILYLNRQYFKSKRTVLKLSGDLIKVQSDLSHYKTETKHLAEGLSQKIDEQFEKWHLTISEKEVALLILKGLSNKEISEVRNTAESTIRQQATAIYHKSNLGSRNELSAFFLEDLFVIKT